MRSPHLIEAGGVTGPYSVAWMRPDSLSSPLTTTESVRRVPGAWSDALTCELRLGVGIGGSSTRAVSVVTPLGIVNVVTLFVGT